MATSFTLHTVDFGNEPDAAQSMSFEYKLWSDSSWILIDSGVSVDTDGTILASPLPSASGLTAGELYDVRTTNECTSPAEYFIQRIQL